MRIFSRTCRKWFLTLLIYLLYHLPRLYSIAWQHLDFENITSNILQLASQWMKFRFAHALEDCFQTMFATIFRISNNFISARKKNGSSFHCQKILSNLTVTYRANTHATIFHAVENYGMTHCEYEVTAYTHSTYYTERILTVLILPNSSKLNAAEPLANHHSPPL